MDELNFLLEDILKDANYAKATIDAHNHYEASECNEDDELYEQSQKYFDRFVEIYKKIERHSYCKVSKFIEKFTADKISLLCNEIENIILFAKGCKWDTNTTTKLEKLYDHISLESVRINRIAALKLSVDNNKIQKAQSEKLLADAKKTFADIDHKHKNLSGQLIAMLGIFSGIVISFAIAASITGQALANLTQNNINHIIIVVLILGIVFINCIIAMLYFIAKLSGHLNQGKPAFVIWISINVVLLLLLFYFIYNPVQLKTI